MTGVVRRVALGYPATGIMTSWVQLVQGASVTHTLPGGPGEFLGFSLGDWNGTSLAFNDMKCKIIRDGVTVFNDFLYDLLMIPTGSTTKGQFASSGKVDGVRCTTSYAVQIAYESSFSIAFKNDNVLTFHVLPVVYYRRGA